MTSIFHIFDPMIIIKTLGLIGVLIIVFAESGLFFGFFFPGDSLLFTAGFLASQNYLNISILVFGAFICAVLGDSVGYGLVEKLVQKFLQKKILFFFTKNI